MKLLLNFYDQKSYFLEITQFISPKHLRGRDIDLPQRCWWWCGNGW